MVAFYGLNEKLGNISYYDSTGEFEQSFQKPYSEATAQLIDSEVRLLIEEAYLQTKEILSLNRQELEQVAALLLEKEVVVSSDLERILGKKNKPSFTL